MGGKLLGLVTARDLEACDDRRARLAEVMTTDVICIAEPTTLREAVGTMIERKVGKLPIVNADNELVALICRGDLRRVAERPQASRDANRQLLVAAAVVAGEASGLDRAKALVDAGADLLMLDTDDGIDGETVAFLNHLKESFSSTDVIVGRVSSRLQASQLL